MLELRYFRLKHGEFVIKNPSHLLRDIIAPSSEALWQRAMSDVKTYDDLPDGTEVPIFNPQITRHEEVGAIEVLRTANEIPYATRQVFETETSLGIDYATRLYQPIGGAKHDFIIDIDTPLSTGVDGLNDEVAARLVREIGVPVILKGPEFSAVKDKNICRLAKVALAATNISQSLSAEVSMEISALIIDSEGLPDTAVVYGKSRGAMVGGKKYPYAKDRGIQIIHYRLIDPCIGKRALASPHDVLRYGLWPVTDMARSIPAFARFALEGNLRQRIKTVERSPAHAIGMVVGTIPSLLSGETMGDRVPLHKGVSIAQMMNNPIADAKDYRAQFSEHVNYDYDDIKGPHIGGIILPRNIHRTVRHMKDLAAEFERANGDEWQINWDNVHNNPHRANRSDVAA
jgi:hypothetical protein